MDIGSAVPAGPQECRDRDGAGTVSWLSMSRGSTPALRALTRDGAQHRVHTYPHDRRSDSYGTEAVREMTERLGVAAEQVFKTLVLEASGGGLAVTVLPIPHSLSLKAAAAALGGRKATMAAQTKAERTTGYTVGGISPLGQRTLLPTVVDESALAWDRILCSAGRRGWEIELAAADLIRLTSATVAALTD